MANCFDLRRKNRENAPRTSLSTLQAENSQNASELSVCCVLGTASIVKICPAHLWKNI